MQELVRLDDAAGDGRGGDDVGAGEVESPWSAAAWEVAVLRADGDGLGRGRSARPGVDARAAARVNQLGPGALENLYVALAARVLLDLLRAELQVEPDAGGDLASLL